MKNKDYIKMLKYFKKVRVYLLIICLLSLLICGVDVVIPIITTKIITNITNLYIDKTIILTIILFSVSILSIIINKISNIVYLKKIHQQIIINIRTDLINKILNLKIVNFDKHTSGEFIERLRNDPENISEILSIMQYSIFSLITNIIIFIYVFYLNFIIGIIFLTCVLITYFYEKYAFKKYEIKSKKRGEYQDKNSTLINEIIRGIRDIKALNIKPRISKIVNNSLKEITAMESNLRVEKNDIYNLIDVFQGITILLILLTGCYLIKIGSLLPTSLIIIFMYRTNIFDMLFCYTTIKSYWTQYKVSASRIFEIMDDSNFPKDNFGKREIKNIKGKIKIKNLSFAYNQEPILKNINLIIEPNDTIGIVGKSGSGKTTLLNVLSKSYYPEDNKVFIDGIDINDLNEESLKNSISVITQNPYIFNLTVRENLTLMNDNITDEEIKKVCIIAQIDDFIESLPDKYDTLLGESGTNLSGGQKQRLAIARALLKRTKIIFMDEATSSLDNVTQRKLQKSINNISDDYTLIIVAHRLSTIKDCNKIYVMDNGKIVGNGTHDELLKNNKIYQNLYKKTI